MRTSRAHNNNGGGSDSVWCRQVCEPVRLAEEPQGLGISPGGVPLQTRVLKYSVATCY